MRRTLLTILSFLRTVRLLTTLTLLILSVVATVARAEVMISGTRVIYEEKQREGVVKVSNTGDMPVLLQAWIDKGDANARPEAIRCRLV